MSTRALGRRVADLARRQTAVAGRRAALARGADAWHAHRVAFLALVPADLRGPVGAALADPDQDEVADWALAPFARWAAPPAGFEFPRALVEVVLRPPRDWFLGHACEACGLRVPLRATRPTDPAPPTDIRVFPACPACGGATSYAAAARPGAS